MWRQCVVELLKFVKMRRVDYILRERERERERELTEKDERVQQWLSSTRTAIKKNNEPPQHGKRKRKCSHVEATVLESGTDVQNVQRRSQSKDCQ